MKKSLISALLVLLLIISLPAAAFADVIYPAPGNVEAGSYMNHLIAELTPGCQVSASGLPEGVSLAEEPGEQLPVTEGAITLPFRPFQIVTLRLSNRA